MGRGVSLERGLKVGVTESRQCSEQAPSKGAILEMNTERVKLSAFPLVVKHFAVSLVEHQIKGACVTYIFKKHV